MGLGKPVDSVGCDTTERVPLSLNVRLSMDERVTGLKIKSSHPFGLVADRAIRTIRKPHLPRDRGAGSGPIDASQEKDALHAEGSAP
ncbi:hypothetical protein [Streptomyces sp. HUAS ZL42]|uniref:hypothetical protein n=1 Tax=Streptomyces sp. HUAS ZL42 TaxID=3231715 RepID=UPI00345E3940